jgi:glycine/D-amino acid oxidase-like deaminating enzyme
LILDQHLLNDQFPYVSDKAVAALHIRRAGWFSAQQLGNLLLNLAKEHGVILIEDQVEGVDLEHDRIKSVRLVSGKKISTHNFIIAAGPYLPQVAGMIGVHLPVFSELHLKVSIKDHLGVVPRNAPLLIWQDAQYLPWSQEERQFLIGDKNSRWLLHEFPPGVHTRPEGPADSPIILMLWEYHTRIVDPIWPPPLDPDYPEIALRGLTTMVPGLSSYIDKPPRPFLDGGYYTKTKENRPLIGPLPVEGAWVIGALSGYGLMASMAAGELLALQMLDKPLPSYAPAFELKRYEDPAYLEMLNNWDNSGQL